MAEDVHYGGGHEDFAREAAELKKQAAARREVVAAEESYQAIQKRGKPLEEEATAKRREGAKVRREVNEFQEREAKARPRVVEGVQADTAAIERNTEARKRAAAAASNQRVQEDRVRSRGALVPHPTEYGDPARAAREAEAARARQAVEGRRVPRLGAQQELPVRAFGGNERYDIARSQRLGEAAQKAGRAAEASKHYGDTLSEEQRQIDKTRTAQARFAAANSGARLEAESRGARNAAVSYGTLSTAMTRHGALSTEFIAAAARGETTLKQLGEQSVATAGKFAGWTLAATALFGAAAAIKRVGDGAITSSSGVDTLRRVIDNVDADKAQQDFSNLSNKFNVPISDSVDAVYRMGQVFHNQADATKAAEAALYSYKTGEVDVATSTKNLIAITNGFGLGANQLVTTFDQINQAQNKFGISIGDTEAGLAKAGGTYKNAGGDLNYLLGLFVAIQKATGRSGTEIGTGISRAVNRIREPISQQKLASQGIEVDPNNFQKTLQRSIRAARRPGADLQTIATGLFGNQYARLIAPVLADQTKLNQALKETSPEKSKGSAQRELNHVLNETKERLSALGNALERLGVQLNQAGAFAGLGIGLVVLTKMFDVAEGLLEVFNHLPAGLRQAVTILAEGYVLMRAMRHFGATDKLAGGPLSVLASPDSRAKTFALQGTRTAQEQAVAEADRVSQARARAQFAAQRAAERERQVGGRYQRDELSGRLPPEHTDARRARDAEVQAANERTSRLTGRAKELADEETDARKYLARTEQEHNRYREMSAKEVRRALDREGVQLPAQLGRPTSRGLLESGQFPRGTEPDYSRVNGRGATTAARSAVSAAEQAAAMNVARSQELRTSDRAIQRAASRGYGALALSQLGTARAMEMIQSSSSPVMRGASRVGAGAGRLRGLPSALTATGRGFGALFGSIAASLGPLELLIGAVAGGFVLKSQIEKVGQENEAFASQVRSYPQNNRQARSRSDAIKRRAAAADKRDADALSRDASSITGGGLFGTGQEVWNKLTGREATDELAQRQVEVERRMKATQRRQRGQGKAVANLNPEQIKKEIQRLNKDAVDGVISEAEYGKEMARVRDEIAASTGSNGRKASLNLMASQSASKVKGVIAPTDFKGRFGKLDVKGLQTEIDNTFARIAQVGRDVGNFDFAEAGAEMRRMETLMKHAKGADLKKLIDSRNAYFTAIEQASSREVEEGLLFARSEGARRNAFSEGRADLNQITAPFRDRFNQARAAQRKAQERVNNLADRDDTSLSRHDRSGGKANIAGYRRQVEQAQKELEAANTDVNKSRKALTEAIQRKKVALQKLIDQEYQDRQQGRQIRLALRQSQSPNESDDAAAALQFAQAQLRDAGKTYGTKSRQYMQALTEVNSAKQAVAQAVLSSVEADNALLTARAGVSGDPNDAARAAVQAARNTLSTMQSNRGQFDKNQIKQAQAALITARTQAAETARNEAKEISDLQNQLAVARAGGDEVLAARLAQQAGRRALGQARNTKERLQALVDIATADNQLKQALEAQREAYFAYLASQTEDPVRQADLEVRRTRQALGGAKGKTDKYQKRADYNKAKTDRRNAFVSEREEEIDFNLEMNKISRDQAISQLESLLRTKNLSKSMRRDILRRIKAIKDQGDEEASGFDLDVGSLKLPTPLDIRKAWDPIRKQVKANHDRNIGALDRPGTGLSTGFMADLANGAAAGRQAAAINNNSIYVYVTDSDAVGQVYEALDRTLGSNVKVKAKSRGRRR